MVLLLYSMYTVHCKVDADAVYSDAEGNVTTVQYSIHVFIVQYYPVKFTN